MDHTKVPNAQISRAEVKACRWVHYMNLFINRRHPVPTKQIFDFNMNLFAYAL